MNPDVPSCALSTMLTEEVKNTTLNKNTNPTGGADSSPVSSAVMTGQSKSIKFINEPHSEKLTLVQGDEAAGYCSELTVC